MELTIRGLPKSSKTDQVCYGDVITFRFNV